MSLAAGCVGIGQGCLDATVKYSHAADPVRPADRLASSWCSSSSPTSRSRPQAARLLVWRVADLVDRGEPFATEASMAKLYASEMAVRAANNALQVFGGYGYIDEFVGRQVPA